MKQAKGLKEVCLSCIERNIDYMLEEGVLEKATPDDDGAFNQQIEELEDKMVASGFSQEEIENILEFVKSSGSMQAAIDSLMQLGENNGIDWDEE